MDGYVGRYYGDAMVMVMVWAVGDVDWPCLFWFGRHVMKNNPPSVVAVQRCSNTHSIAL